MSSTRPTRGNGQSAVDPEGAFLRYLSMGPRRSLRKLVPILKNEIGSVSLGTIERWSKRDRWTERADEFDLARTQQLEDELLEEAREMDLRQARMGRAMQYKADEGLQQIPSSDLTASDVSRLAKDGSQIERLAVGAETSREATNYNAIIIPIAQLFQQVVFQVVPEEYRERLMREFADGVDSLRDTIVEG